MGVYCHSVIPEGTTPEIIEGVLATLVPGLWGEEYRVVRTRGVPTTPEDNREATWEFHLPDLTPDCAFTFSLLKDNRLEFKVPRSQWDEWWRDQQRLRRRLVRQLRQGKNEGDPRTALQNLGQPTYRPWPRTEAELQRLLSSSNTAVISGCLKS